MSSKHRRGKKGSGSYHPDLESVKVLSTLRVLKMRTAAFETRSARPPLEGLGGIPYRISNSRDIFRFLDAVNELTGTYLNCIRIHA